MNGTFRIFSGFQLRLRIMPVQNLKNTTASDERPWFLNEKHCLNPKLLSLSVILSSFYVFAFSSSVKFRDNLQNSNWLPSVTGVRQLKWLLYLKFLTFCQDVRNRSILLKQKITEKFQKHFRKMHNERKPKRRKLMIFRPFEVPPHNITCSVFIIHDHRVIWQQFLAIRNRNKTSSLDLALDVVNLIWAIHKIERHGQLN